MWCLQIRGKILNSKDLKMRAFVHNFINNTVIFLWNGFFWVHSRHWHFPQSWLWAWSLSDSWACTPEIWNDLTAYCFLTALSSPRVLQWRTNTDKDKVPLCFLWFSEIWNETERFGEQGETEVDGLWKTEKVRDRGSSVFFSGIIKRRESEGLMAFGNISVEMWN